VNQCTKENEEFKKGTECERTCENRNGRNDCPLLGKCLCEEGYLRDSKNNCVKPKDCPSQTTAQPATTTRPTTTRATTTRTSTTRTSTAARTTRHPDDPENRCTCNLI
jgi:hypothetical protein